MYACVRAPCGRVLCGLLAVQPFRWFCIQIIQHSKLRFALQHTRKNMHAFVRRRTSHQIKTGQGKYCKQQPSRMNNTKPIPTNSWPGPSFSPSGTLASSPLAKKVAHTLLARAMPAHSFSGSTWRGRLCLVRVFLSLCKCRANERAKQTNGPHDPWLMRLAAKVIEITDPLFL
ncbi:hypothetical protein BD289DRAFT_109534 [Coniella lustricola]|uniref:Uncharacterized protein n=1 Tax=Coniella lustricola TaxID=2025994 RepID=A0A2T2ZXE6_9PEZI|nr:hypothetical protein BD289DRAFT_109534 [Coniella lustricola]